jgi:16S rRNA (cytosine967-C5)-methyltransferase
MHPNALLELATDLLHKVLQFEAPADRVVSDFFRTHRELGRASATPWPRPPTRAAPAPAVPAPGPVGQGRDGAPPGAAGLAGQRGFPAWRPVRAGAAVAGAGQGGRPARLPAKLRHNLPEWLAEPLMARPGRGVLEAGRQPQPAGAARSAGQHLQGQARGRAGRAQGRRHRRRAHAVFALGPAHPGQAGAEQARRLHRGRSRCRTKAASCWPCSPTPSAARWWSTSAPAPAARRWRWARPCATPGACTPSTPRATGSRRSSRAWRAAACPTSTPQIAHERDERIKRLAGKIDRVLVDAPCSGLGTLRRNPDMKWRQSPEGVEELKVKQAAILASAARLLKPGGRLVYATCSLLDGENEASPARSAPPMRDFKPLAAAEMLDKAHVSDRRRIPGAGRLPAFVAAQTRHRRIFCRRVGTSLKVS